MEQDQAHWDRVREHSKEVAKALFKLLNDQEQVEPKIELTFMVVPEFLETHCIVPDRVMIKIIDPEAIFLTGILGESGRKMVSSGIPFYFTRHLAEKLIEKGIAIEVKNEKTN